ncbi:MAG TPA: Leg1-related protein [Kofleriaceae bacterium]
MWADYYAAIDAAREDVAAGRLSPREQSQRSRELQRDMWDVHVAAVEAGLSTNRDRLAQLPPPEQRFARAWGYTAVEFIAAGDFPSDRDSIGRTQAIILPLRLVADGDFGDGSADLTWHQHMALHAMDALHEAERLTNHALFRAWQEALAEPRCAALCPFILDQALAEELDGLPSYLRSALDVLQGIDRRPAWAVNGSALSCSGSDPSALSCKASGTTRSFTCSLASGVREWSCRTCVADGTAVFVRMFCPAAATNEPGGACSVVEAAEIASGGC